MEARRSKRAEEDPQKIRRSARRNDDPGPWADGLRNAQGRAALVLRKALSKNEQKGVGLQRLQRATLHIRSFQASSGDVAMA